MSGPSKESLSHENGSEFYRREEVDTILYSDIKRSFSFYPLSLPIAGPRLIFFDEKHSKLSDVPREILSPDIQPIIICDWDDSVADHAWIFVKAVGEATGKTISREHYREIGHSRKIPEWMNENDMAIHDRILRNEDPKYFPFVNPAKKEAVTTLIANKRMGHNISYLTARPQQLAEATFRTLDWNNVPRDSDQREYIDSFSHNIPKDGYVYLGKEMPMMDGDKPDFKSATVAHWLSNLKQGGWTGTCVVIDDLMGPFADFLLHEKIIGIVPESDVNFSRQKIEGEIRVPSWNEIDTILMNVHEQAVANDPSRYRRFWIDDNEHREQILEVEKEASGNGFFELHNLSSDAYRWINVGSSESIQEQFSRLARD